jgi:AcrR family transcriptional regulator
MAETVKPKRSYASVVRREQAARTRARILDAAGPLFDADGYARTTMRGIAQHAEVAADTVYATFGSKARVLTALIDHRLDPTGDVRNVLDTPEAQAIRTEPNQRRQVHLFARWVAATLARVRPVYEILRTASAVDQDMTAIYEEIAGYRLRNMHTIAEWIAARGALRVEIDRAAEIIWAVASPDVTRLLCDQRGWTEREYAHWLEDFVARSLLPDAD